MGAQAWPDEKSAMAFALAMDGLSYSQIAARLGISRSAVSGYMNRHGVRQELGPMAPKPKPVTTPRQANDGRTGRAAYEAPRPRENDDNLHLTLLLAGLRAERGRAAA